MPIAFLVSRYTMAIGVSVLAFLTLPNAQGAAENSSAVHWLRAIVVPLLFTSTSAVIGYRAVILHFERPQLVSRLIHTLLAAEFIGGITVMTLSVADPTDPNEKLGGTMAYVSPTWVCAPLVIAIVIDFILTLIVVVPILSRGEKPRKGEVVHMLLSDATFFGIFSIVVKAMAMGFTLSYSKRDTNPYLPVRVESVASTIFACRIFRGQESFLRSQREKMANPSLKPIELDAFTSTTSTTATRDGHGREGMATKPETTKAEKERSREEEEEEKPRKHSHESVRWKATVTLTDCCAGSKDIHEEERGKLKEQARKDQDENDRRRLSDALVAF